MKKLFLSFSLILISFSIYSQAFYGKDAQSIIPGAEMVIKDTILNTPSFIRFAKGSEIEFIQIEKWLSDHIKISSDFGMNLIRAEKDNLGYTHYRYQQTYKGFPIHSNIFIIHVKDNMVVSMNGQLFSKLEASAVAALTETDALNKALTFVGADTYKWQIPEEETLLKNILNNESATYYPKGELMMVSSDNNFKGTNYHLAYRFDVYAHHPMSRRWIFVDASTGQIIKTLQRIQSENHDINSNDPATAVTKYKGTRNIMTDNTGPSAYRLREIGRGNGIETYDMNTGTNYGSAVDFTNTSTTWTAVNNDQVARDAHWGTEATYDYYSIKHSRNSIDNAGFKLISYVHYDVDYANAFWNSEYMTYGDGDTDSDPFTTLDICGHEITHGLTEFTAGLAYEYESGALNEGFSDIFGTSIEFYASPPFESGNWLIGEDIGYAFRSMSAPNDGQQPDTYLGDYWYTGSDDYGGVHTNSGVVNFWYYLLCQGGSGTNDNSNAYSVTAITMAKAELIAFRALTVYLTSTSQYADARTYTLQACSDIYGGCSQEMISATNAWYAVGVGAAYSATPTDANFTACPKTQCTNAPFTVQFSNLSTNGNTYKWYFGDGSTSTSANPSHTYTANGTYDVKLVAYGNTCGSDSITKTAFIMVGSTYPCPVSIPASGTGTTQTSCTGSLYDSGLCSDYANNTDGKITISPINATSVTLTFTSFSFEGECACDYLYIYNGPTTTYPQVTGSPFSGTTLPGPITSSGGSITIRQYSDPYVVYSGFSLDWSCTSPATPPVPAFVADKTSSCTGTITFTDQSSNTPNAWLWKFGDGQTSTLQNPTHTYNANGTYTVKLKAYNTYGNDSLTKTNYIAISMPSVPSVVGTTICSGSSAHLTASGSGILKWYSSLTSTPILQTGTAYDTPVLTSTTNYYVKDSVIGAISHGGRIDSVSGAGGMFITAYEHWEVFDTYVPLVLQTVKIYANAPQTGKVISLKNSAGTTITSATVNLVLGINTVTLNFTLPVDTGLRLAGPLSPGWYRNTAGFTYPITIPGKLSIKRSSAGSTLRYYYFYDWVVKEADCVSPRVIVTATVNTCTGFENENPNALIQVSPNPADNFITVDINGYADQQTLIEIYNLQGQKLYKNLTCKIPEIFRKTIDLSGFAKGIYMIRIQAGKTNSLHKIEIL